MNTAARVLMIAVAVMLLAVSLRLVGRRSLRSKYALLWLIIGLMAVGLAAFPAIVDRAADALGIAYAPTLLLVFACVVLLLVAMQFSWELSRLEARSRRLAEEVALIRADLAASPDESTDE